MGKSISQTIFPAISATKTSASILHGDVPASNKFARTGCAGGEVLGGKPNKKGCSLHLQKMGSHIECI